MMRDDFCAFILTHGRADRVYTYRTLRKAGYTGKIYIVIDDEDEAESQYREIYGDEVLQFCKRDVAEWTDDGDNFGHRKSVIYARNACWDLARKVGCKYFIQLDDDYTSFIYRTTPGGKMVKHRIDDVLLLMLEYYLKIPAASITMSQGGDHMGGGMTLRARRKAMNSFICSTEREFCFFGRVNEDVNTYTTESRKGVLFLTILPIQLNQVITQSNPGGWTEYYLEHGTYVKTFYSVMSCPSGVQIGFLKDPRHEYGRIHHKINWHKTAPKILREEWKKRPDNAD